MIYILEDDGQIRAMEEYALKAAGFEVCGFENGDDFLKKCLQTPPRLAILDVMLPGIDGLEVLRRIRQQEAARNVPVIMVTAKTSELDVVTGLDEGADDYITKPFGIMELLSRVKAVLRRTEQEKKQEKTQLECGAVQMDEKTHTVRCFGEEISLTYKEYALLKIFLQHPQEVVARETLLYEVWGTDFFGESRTLDMHIRTLRQKLGEAGAQIATVRKVGYRMTSHAQEDHRDDE